MEVPLSLSSILTKASVMEGSERMTFPGYDPPGILSRHSYRIATLNFYRTHWSSVSSILSKANVMESSGLRIFPDYDPLRILSRRPRCIANPNFTERHSLGFSL
jgi:hypothetical protein